MSREKLSTRDRERAVWEILQTVFDPELGANLVDLNMIRSVSVLDDKAVIEMVLTVPRCPLAWWLEAQVAQATLNVPGIVEVEVRLLHEPWQPPAADWQRWLEDARVHEGL